VANISIAEIAVLLWCGLYATKQINGDTLGLLTGLSVVYGLLRSIICAVMTVTPVGKQEDATRR